MDRPVRWTITVSEQTDLELRRHLGSRGMKKGDLSKFVEDAVRWRVFDQTVQAVKDRNADLSPEALEALIDEALEKVRAEKRQEGEAQAAVTSG